MSLYRRPTSPYWWALLEGTDDGKGNPVRFSTKIRRKGATPAQTKANRRLAEAAYQASLGDVARARFDLPPEHAPPRRTFREQAIWYETHHTARHRGAAQERQKLARLRRFFDRAALDAITPTRWQEYTTERMTRDGVRLSTVGRELAILKLVLNSAIPEYLEFNPLWPVKRRSPKLTAKRTITRAEERVFLAALRRLDREIADLYVVGVGTLLRQATLLNLTRSEHRGASLAVLTKTGPQQIPLTGPTELQRRAARVLRRRMPTTPDGYFFPRWRATFAREGQPAASVHFLRRVRRAAAAAHLPWGLHHDGIVWHTATRATGATRLLREYGIDVRTVQLLGHWASLDQMADYLGIDLDLRGQRATA